MQTETLAIRISKAERTALRQRARKEKVSQGDLVRRALRAYGVTPHPAPAQTGYDVIKHLIGRCQGGPRDLSTNPAHLADHGRG
ncbi:MAG: ribbon-helix-helix protein, CopG family [Opitutus sp.]|nr:ribbon-helix-helix protein, CopG family [Opitutus sp.]